MKYLKLFESFGGGEYEEVDYNTWNSFGIISTLKESQINKIVESMKTKGFIDWHKEGGYKRETIIFVSGLFTKVRTKIIISAMQDEWFKVCIMKSKKTQVTYDKQYYLCDEFGGLIKLLEEVL